MFHFFSASPFPVTVSDDTKKKMLEMCLDPVAELSFDKNTFSGAFGEVYNTVVPHFRKWISTNEWRGAVPFHRIAPPSFSVVLSSGTLRILFNRYLKSHIDHEKDVSASRAFHLWKFCLIANDFRDGKCTHESHLDVKKKKKRKTSDSEKSKNGKEEDGDKKLTPEEYAKRLYKKYKYYISLPYDSTMSYSVFVVRALDQIIEEFDKSALFARWIELKPYQGVDYQAKTVHQSLTPEGFADPPTLASMITSSILPAMAALVQGSEPGMNLEFLVDILVFHEKFMKFDQTSSSSSSGQLSSSQDSLSSSKNTKQDMIEEAKRIFNKFLDKGEMHCDPGLVEEVRGLVTKNGGKGVHPSMFRKCGAFIYHRSEHTWCREARATFEWVSRSYDNRSNNSRGVEEEFSLKILPEDVDLQIVPSIDDIYENPSLVEDYSAFVNKQCDGVIGKFSLLYLDYFKTPIHERKPALKKLLACFADVSEKFPDLKAASGMFAKELEGRERVSDIIINVLFCAAVRSAASRFHKPWLVEHAMVWKTAKWTPATAVRFSELYMLVTLNAVESKIEEDALKGKTGFSRYLAKRHLKKQTLSYVRSSSATHLVGNKSTVVSSGTLSPDAKEPFSPDSPASPTFAVQLIVPSLQDTLSSPYLRDLFGRTFLATALSASEMTLWEALCAFFPKYQSMQTENIFEAQDAMRSDALKLCEKFKSLIKNSSELKERIKKQKFMLPQVFRPLEEEVYAKYHAEYEVSLRKKGWM